MLANNFVCLKILKLCKNAKIFFALHLNLRRKAYLESSTIPIETNVIFHFHVNKHKFIQTSTQLCIFLISLLSLTPWIESVECNYLLHIWLNRLNSQTSIIHTLCSHDIIFIMTNKERKKIPRGLIIIFHLFISHSLSLSLFILPLFHIFLSSFYLYYRVQYPLALASSLNIQRQRLHNSLNPFFIINGGERRAEEASWKNDPGPLHVVGCNLFCMFM